MARIIKEDKLVINWCLACILHVYKSYTNVDDGTFGCLLNHSKLHPNVKPVPHTKNGQFKTILFVATTDIRRGKSYYLTMETYNARVSMEAAQSPQKRSIEED